MAKKRKKTPPAKKKPAPSTGDPRPAPPPIPAATLQARRKVKTSRARRRRTTHKRRSGWFQARASWPFREPSVSRLMHARTRAAGEMRTPAMAHRWQPVGPTNVGGRLTSIVSHPDDADRIWVGAAGGGVWESRDAGKSWSTVWHQEATLNIGSLAIDARAPQNLYCGTGEANLSADSYAGVGVYRSTDGGASWEVRAEATAAGIPLRIGALQVDPFDSAHLALGGIGFGGAPTGLFLSSDFGARWTAVALPEIGRYWCHAIAYDPGTAGTLYVAVTTMGTGSGIFRSRDGGARWQRLGGGLPAGHRIHRASLAVSPSHPHVLYTLIADAGTDGESVLGVFRSNNRGATWAQVDHGFFAEEGQMSYNNALAVDPTDPDRVICGGVDLHRTIDGGSSWQQVTHWYEERGNPHYAHADQHGLHFPAADPNRVYAANDGGLDVSFDRGRSWRNRSDGLQVTMFYDLDISQLNSDLFAGGAQDNGTPLTEDGGKLFFDVTGGDGGWSAFDPRDIDHLFVSVYNMQIFRFRDGWTEVTPQGATPEEEKRLEDERNSVWMVFLALDPADGSTLYTGTRRVWRTRDDGDNWETLSSDLDGSPITAIAIARSDPRVLYVGTENGGLFRSLDRGRSWEGNLANGQLPDRTVTRIAVQPDEPGTVLVTVAGFGHGHVFRSKNSGTTWEDVSAGLPDAPFQSLVIPATRPRTVYACGDAGVYASGALGTGWRNLTGNLPNTMMVDLVYHEGDGALSVATYGRSVWRLKV